MPLITLRPAPERAHQTESSQIARVTSRICNGSRPISTGAKYATMAGTASGAK